MLADDLLSHFVLGSTYHVNCLGFVTVSTFFAVYLKLLVWFNLLVWNSRSGETVEILFL